MKRPAKPPGLNTGTGVRRSLRATTEPDPFGVASKTRHTSESILDELEERVGFAYHSVRLLKPVVKLLLESRDILQDSKALRKLSAASSAPLIEEAEAIKDRIDDRLCPLQSEVESGLREMSRECDPGGRLGILVDQLRQGLVKATAKLSLDDPKKRLAEGSEALAGVRASVRDLHVEIEGRANEALKSATGALSRFTVAIGPAAAKSHHRSQAVPQGGRKRLGVRSTKGRTPQAPHRP